MVFLNDKLSPMSNASPSIEGVTRNNSFKKGCVGKILSFVLPYKVENPDYGEASNTVSILMNLRS